MGSSTQLKVIRYEIQAGHKRTERLSIFVAIIIHERDDIIVIPFDNIESADFVLVVDYRITDTNIGMLVLPPMTTLRALIFLWVGLFDIVIRERSLVVLENIVG
jgi:hypothetical protein